MTVPLRKLTDAFSETAIGDEIVVMSLSSGDFFSLEDTGRAIWLLIDGTRDEAGVLAALAEQYGGDVDRGEVVQFLTALCDAGFLAD